MMVRPPLLGVLTLVVAACGGSTLTGLNSLPPSGSTASPSRAPALVPALTVDRAAVTVSPATGLTDGQTITVSVTGFGIGGKVWLSECASAAVATDLGCGSQLAGQTLLVTDESRAGSAEFIARAKAAAQPLAANPLSLCADRCVIVATLGGGYAFATAPIVFGGASSPPTASRTPTPAEIAAAVAAVTAYTTDLVHGQYEAAFAMLSAPDRARMGPLAVYSANEGQLFKSVAGQFNVVPFPTDMAPISDWAATSGLTVDLRHAVLVEVTYPVIAPRNAWDLFIVQPGATGLVLYDVR